MIRPGLERTSRFRRVSDLDGLPVPVREFVVEGMIPMRTVTMLGGDGATGKSLLLKQLGAATVTGTRWLGREVRQGGVLYLSAEDEEPEMHRRFAAIAGAMDCPLRDLSRYVWRSLAGEDALLAVEGPNGLEPTPLLAEVEEEARRIPDLAWVGLDTSADLFPANENDRAAVRQFIGILRGLAMRLGCAVILLSHPSLTGLNSGTGTSGSTAWNNSVRSRLYLERIKDGAHEPDVDARKLTVMKANYDRAGGEILLRWERGVFVAQDTGPAPTGLDRLASGAKAERVFLKLLDEFTSQGRFVSPNSSLTYGPLVFSRAPGAEGVSKRALISAMELLFSRGVLTVEQHGRGASKRDHIARAIGADEAA